MRVIKFIKNISLLFTYLMLFLIVSFPISASTIQGKVYGESEIPNFSKGEGDKLTFEVLISSQDISLDNIFIHFPSFNTQFSFSSTFCVEASCEDASPGSKKCTCVSNWGYGEPFSIVYKFNEVSSRAIQFTPDYKRPSLQNVELNQKDNKIEIKLLALDEACDNCNTCSGIKEIIVSDSSGPKATFEINSNECSIEFLELFDYNAEGNIIFDILVKDNLWSSPSDVNHQFKVTRTVSVDFTPPTFSNNYNVYKSNERLTHINPNGMLGTTISVIVEDSNLDKISVKLSDLGNNNDISLSSIDNYCTKLQGNSYNCSFSNVHINNHNARLNITAVDEMGNIASSLLNSNLILDNNKPQVEFIGTLASFESQSYVKNGENTFVLKINKQGSNINKQNVLLNLGSLNLGNNLVADECVKENNLWICKWTRNFNIVNNQNYPISLGACFDNAGNACEGMQQASLIADNLKPEIENIEIFSVGELGRRTYFQSNDVIFIEATIKKQGSNLKEAFADFSDLYTSTNNLVPGVCTSIDDLRYLCKWETSRIKSGYYNAKLNFKFNDYGLNSNEIEKSVFVYGISTNVPNNFEAVVNTREIIPNSINLLVASLLTNPPGYKILVPFTLTGGGNDIRILSYNVENCNIQGDRRPYENLFMDVRNPTPNNVPLLKSTNQSNNIMEFTMGHFDSADLNMLKAFDVTCQINIYQSQKTFDGEFVFSNPEVKNISFRLNVEGSALDGKPGDKAIELIQERRKGILEKTKFITDAANVVNKLEGYCAMVSQVVSVWNIFATIESLGAALSANPQWKWLYKVGCYGYEGFGSVIGKLYYGSTLISENKFSVTKCDKNLNADTLTGSAKRNIESPELMSDAFKQWKPEGKGLSFPGLKNICGFVSCQYSTVLAEKLSNATGGNIIRNVSMRNASTNEIEQNWFTSYFSLPRNAPSANTKNSIVMSTVSMCIPGMIYNLNKFRQIECDYIVCLKEVSESGGPISICDQQKSQTYCLAFFGEAFEIVGIFRFISAIGSALSSSATELLPQALKATLDSAVCNKKGTSEGDNMKVAIVALCDVPRAIHNTIDSFNMVKGLTTYGSKSAWTFNRPNNLDSCSIVFSEDFIENLPPPSIDDVYGDLDT